MRIKVNGKETEVSAELPLIEELQRLGYDIPSLCYGRDMEHQASCMVCMVKNAANGQMIPSCSTFPQEGMSIETDTEEVLALRRMSLELLLSDHRADCEAPCTIVCPSGINVAQLLLYYDRGQLEEAYSLIMSAAGSASLPCEDCKAPCEKACRRGTVDESVSIRGIIREVMKTLSPLTHTPMLSTSDFSLKGREPVREKKSPFKGSRRLSISEYVSDLEGPVLFTSRLGRYTDAEKKWLKEVYSQPSRCLHCACEGSNKCRLRQVATDAHIKTLRYGISSHQEVKKQIHVNGKLYFEPAKCIRCGLCVYNSTNGFTFMHRGFDMQVVIPEESKKNVDEKIADICPTGALYLI